MDARRGKLAAALTAASMCALSFAGPAEAATVTAHPPQYVKPSAAPFTGAADALSGIATYAWIPHDGAAPVVTLPRTPRITSDYAPGVWTGAVTAVDRAGNAATQGFTVTAAPASPVVAAPDGVPPSVFDVRLGSAVLKGHVLPVSFTLSERATTTVTASVRAAGHTYRLAVARRTLLGRPVTVRIAVKAAVRQAIARALRRHRAVRATVAIVAVDRAGNRQSTAAAARITG